MRRGEGIEEELMLKWEIRNPEFNVLLDQHFQIWFERSQGLGLIIYSQLRSVSVLIDVFVGTKKNSNVCVYQEFLLFFWIGEWGGVGRILYLCWDLQ